MLRAKERQHRIRKMTLHQFRGPEFPILKKEPQRFAAPGISMPTQKLSRGRGRSRARVQQRNVHFAFGKRSINKWQVADDRCKKAEPEPGFCNHERTR